MIEAFEKKHGLTVMYAWGMTETSPLGTVSRLQSWHEALPEDNLFTTRAKQGAAVSAVEIRAVDERGRETPWDGKTYGELQVRGPWVIGEYYNDECSIDSFVDG